MPVSVRDRIAGSVLFAIALIWIFLVFQTIEPSQDTSAGPRAFPLFFGIALAVLSLLLLLQTFRPQSAAQSDIRPPARSETLSVVATIGTIVIYGALMEPLGFIISTALIVAAIMIVILRMRTPVMIAAMSIGLSLGCYLVFGKLLGTYLPPGTWITIYF
jgi:putative tricarboxylic transport membrane protein